MKWLMLVVALVLNALANILIKAGMRNYTGGVSMEMVLYMMKNPFVIFGLLSFGGAFVGYSLVLSRMDLSVAYPIMTGAGFAIVAMVSALWFSEGFPLWKILGIVLIGIGIWLVAGS